VRGILAEQIDLRADGLEYVALQDLPAEHRYFAYQETVNAGGAPSEQVIDQNRASAGRDFRDETEGDNPIVDLREPAPAAR
jgi:hypothetical protein